MPRIRKKTSKRGTTHQRARIKHKVAESRRKAKKATKKNPQWKSKHAKDPGIPNSFPYKAEILAEIAAQRRQEEEERQKRKEQKKAERAAARAVVEAGEDDEEDAGDATTAFDGISSVGASSLTVAQKESATKGQRQERTVAAEVEDEDEDVPILMNSDYTDLKSVLVLDARDPLAHQSPAPAAAVERSKKKKVVSFAPHPRGTKQSRLQSHSHSQSQKSKPLPPLQESPTNPSPSRPRSFKASRNVKKQRR